MMPQYSFKFFIKSVSCVLYYDHIPMVHCWGKQFNYMIFPFLLKFCLQCRRPRFDFWVGKIHQRRDSYPLQYSWDSLVAQMVKNPLAMQETWVWFLGWEDTLEKGTVTHSTILAWRIPWTEEPGRLQSMGSQSWTWLTNFHSCFPNSLIMSFDYFQIGRASCRERV